MKRITPIILTASAFLLTLVFAAPVQAHDRHDNRQRVDQRQHRQHKQHKRFDRHDRRSHHQDRSYRHDRRYERRDRYERFEVPRRIHDRGRHEYRSYFQGTTYFAAHRHQHSVYRFPVRIDQGWGYRQHAYCAGDLFVDHGRIDLHGRRFSISLGF